MLKAPLVRPAKFFLPLTSLTASSQAAATSSNSKCRPACQSFTLEVAGQRYTQPLPEEDHEEEEEEHEQPSRLSFRDVEDRKESHRGKRHRH
jgi:hypothetical protein